MLHKLIYHQHDEVDTVAITEQKIINVNKKRQEQM
jgi:hypothetical protein